MSEFDDYYKALVEKLERDVENLKRKFSKRGLLVVKLETEKRLEKSRQKTELIESKKCIDNLSAELGRVKRKLKRESTSK